jgi:hypothetical protein
MEKFDEFTQHLKKSLEDHLFEKKDIDNCKRDFISLEKYVEENKKDAKLTLSESGVILKMIFYPFAVPLVDEYNLSASFLMISIISWWLQRRNVKAPATYLLNLLLERKYYDYKKINLKDSKSGHLKLSAIQSHPKSLKSLLKLFELKNSSSIDCDNLICLIITILENFLQEKNDECGFKYLFRDCNFSSLWKLYFDPLLIKSALNQNKKEINTLIRKETFIPTEGFFINVTWTDDRSEKHIETYKRVRIDSIVNICLKNLDWNECLHFIKSIKWNEINFKAENSEFICKQLVPIISCFFDQYKENNNDLMVSSLNNFLHSLASNASILIRDTNFLRDFTKILFDKPILKLIESSKEFLRRFIQNFSENEMSKDFQEFSMNLMMFKKVIMKQ